MRLEDYWGVGPKTSELLAEELGVEEAVRAIESADSRTLTEAGLGSGRATRILRRVHGGEGLAVLATGDARAVYRDIIDRIADHAVTRDAADRIRVLTPLDAPAAIEDRLDSVDAAVSAWRGLGDGTRAAVVEAFAEYDAGDGGERAAVEAAVALAETDATAGPFSPLAALDVTALREASAALAAFDGSHVGEGADETLDELRTGLADAERLAGDPGDVVATIQEGGVRGTEGFRDAFVDHVATETALAPSRVREAMPDGATDAATFVDETMRSLTATLREEAEERERAVAEELSATVEAAREDIDAAVEAVDDIGFWVSLARFADALDLTRPDVVTDRESLAVVNARNLSLASQDAVDVQPVTYAVGDHGLEGTPTGDRVAVLTGANSGGKTTLLETLCQVALLATMGLPVPAERAEVSVADRIVFHRRHASFNAGVLESTLRSVVPPLSGEGRTLMLVDEFEAITEPGSAADLLHGLVTLTVEREAAGVFVTHLADDLEPLPDAARIDGIFAEGLTPDLELEVDYQPRFGTVGRSTPEFIVSRLVAGADDRSTRAGFETLAAAVGEAAVQRTLADARWDGTDDN